MKTKIMLFCAVILAVALIGLARPSSRAEVEPVMGTLLTAGPGVSENTPSPPIQEVQPSPQGQEQTQAEEKKDQEEQKQKEQKQKEQKRTVGIPVQEGEKHKHKIIITEGDKVKTIVVDKPVIIKEGKKGNFIIFSPDGKEFKVLEGESPHLEILTDKLEVIEEGKIVKVGKDGTTFYVVVKPDVHISEEVNAAINKAVEDSLDVGVPVTVKVNDLAVPHITVVSEDQENEIREKLREIREKLKAVEEKKLELREVDKALADLEKDLEKLSRKTSGVAHTHLEKADVFTIEPKKVHEEGAAESERDVGVDIGEHSHKTPITVIAKDKGSFSMFYQLEPGGKGRVAYDRIVARVGKELPEGFTLEPGFEEESGLVTLKVKGPFDKGAPSDLVKKLADSVRQEMKGKQE